MQQPFVKMQRVMQYKVNLPDQRSKINVTITKILQYGLAEVQALMFVRSKETAELLQKELIAGCKTDVAVVHGDLAPEARNELANFFNNEHAFQILITTDVAFLFYGMNEDTLLVVNFDLPVQGDTFYEPDIDVFTQQSCLKAVKGAVFNLLCGNTDKMLMEMIERCLELKVNEVPFWKSEIDFLAAFKKRWLLVEVSV